VLKKVLMVLIALTVMLDAKNMVRMKQVESGETRQIAVESAYWNMFEDALGKTIGDASYDGSIVKSFESDFNKDFRTFQRTHFKNTKVKCNDNGPDGFECMVMASMDLDRMRKLYSKKSNSSTAMGRNKIEDVEVVLIDDVGNKLSALFANELHAFSKKSGADLRVEKKGTPVGSKGTNCKKLKEKLKVYKRKGRAYKSAVDATQEKLIQCEENKGVNYAFRLVDLELNINEKKDRYGSYKGEITYTIHMLNTQTGKRENSIPGETVSTFGNSINKLKSKLAKKAANMANTEMNNNMLDSISTKTRKKKSKKLNKYEYTYTAIIRGLTTDADDRHKRKIIKETIKELGSKAKKNTAESSEFEQVYNFGSNEELDMEEFSDMLYDMADSLGFRIQVSEKSDDIVVIQFQ